MRTLRGLRADENLSQEDFAKLFNIPLSTYQRYERYEVTIPCEFIVSVADHFKIADIRDIRYK